jgi:hypothetical protein
MWFFIFMQAMDCDSNLVAAVREDQAGGLCGVYLRIADHARGRTSGTGLLMPSSAPGSWILSRLKLVISGPDRRQSVQAICTTV